jgi:hypothetical protein
LSCSCAARKLESESIKIAIRAFWYNFEKAGIVRKTSAEGLNRRFRGWDRPEKQNTACMAHSQWIAELHGDISGAGLRQAESQA